MAVNSWGLAVVNASPKGRPLIVLDNKGPRQIQRGDAG